MESIRTTVTVRGGRIEEQFSVSSMVSRLQDGRYDLSVQPAGRKRSNAQNNSWWKFRVEPLADYLGWEREDMHEFLKIKFLSRHVFFMKEDGSVEETAIPGSTKKLSVEQFSALFEEVARWAVQELNVVLPDPMDRMEVHQ